MTTFTQVLENQRLPIAPLLLGLCMCLTAASGLINEYILATVSTYILGNAIQQFSIIIAVMLAAMGIATAVQKFLGDSLLVEKFISVEIVLALAGGFAPIAIYAAFGTMPNHFPLVQYTFVFTIGFLIGFEIPLVMRINEAYQSQLKVNLGTILSMDYVGSFIGAVFWVYFLLRTFPLTEISFMVAGINFVVAAFTFLYFVKKGLVKTRVVPLVVIVLALAALVYGYTNNRDWNISLEQKFYDYPIVLQQTTKYQHLVVTHNPYLNEYRAFLNGNTQFSSGDEHIYHEHLVHPVMYLARQHHDVLILGGGDGLALREVLKYPSVDTVTLVDLDPDMIQIASTHPVFQELNNHAFADARVHTELPDGMEFSGVRSVYVNSNKLDALRDPIPVRVASVDVYTMDADQFIGSVPGNLYDVVIIDFPDPGSVELSKLYSKEFYLKLKHRVRDGGMVALQATSPYHAKPAFLTIKRTLEAAGFHTLPYHDNVPSFGDWGWIAAWTGDTTPDTMRQRINTLHSYPVETRHLTPEVSRAALVFGKGALVPHPDNVGKINTLMFPILLTQYKQESWKVE